MPAARCLPHFHAPEGAISAGKADNCGLQCMKFQYTVGVYIFTDVEYIFNVVIYMFNVGKYRLCPSRDKVVRRRAGICPVDCRILQAESGRQKEECRDASVRCRRGTRGLPLPRRWTGAADVCSVNRRRLSSRGCQARLHTGWHGACCRAARIPARGGRPC